MILEVVSDLDLDLDLDLGVATVCLGLEVSTLRREVNLGLHQRIGARYPNNSDLDHAG